MSTKRYVQHVSGQGEKWEVCTSYNGTSAEWCVLAKDQEQAKMLYARHVHYLPRSEYRECEPPERWTDVTDQVQINTIEHASIHANQVLHLDENPSGPTVVIPKPYRLLKVELWKGEAACHKQWAFLVERREP